HRPFLSDDPSLRCVFPCEGNERPSQGLSLSLNSSNPAAIGVQPFELRQHHHHDSRFGQAASSRSSQVSVQTQTFSLLRNSKYLGPAQDLLNQFCNLAGDAESEKTLKSYKNTETEEEDAVNRQALYSLDVIELQRRKSKLLQMLDEVDNRYRHYCDQMKAVNASFEAIAGDGAARVYSRMASKAMSRHFRCLRDGIAMQIRSVRKAMGEKDCGMSKGETPRLRLLDQTLRQQRALQQMSMMETHPWRPQRGLPERAVSMLRAWLFEHFLHPYPCDVDKHILARQTGLSRSQVSNWFINARVRLWKPMVEEMYREELKESETGQKDPDQKPTRQHFRRTDSECLSSIINADDKNGGQRKNKEAAAIHQNLTAFSSSSYGPQMEMDFSSYAHRQPTGVSLTLGLHQHAGGGGGGLTFLPPAAVFEQMEECQNQQFTLLESENQTLPYRNLMGAQLLHDLAG
ncbi:hypothetical protein M569_16677, partial [Genlisea aurea]